MRIFQMPLRIDSELATKIRMIAAANNIPMNTYIAKILAEHAEHWECTHGKLPVPADDAEEDTQD